MMRKIAVISGSRADAGLLEPLMSEINHHPLLELQLFVTGMHLCEEYGLTYKELEKNFSITDKIAVSLTENTPQENAKALGEGIIGFSHSLHKFHPDILLILGDRFEILAAAEAAMMLQIPIAHLHGGELTLGAIDDAIRHAISKMAHLHFTATEEYRQRLIQMGEQPGRVYNVGATAMDNILAITAVKQSSLEKRLQIKLQKKIFLLTWHPETIHLSKNSKSSALSALKALLNALENFPEHQIIFTKANADAGGQAINNFLDNYINNRENYHLFTALGIQNYLTLVRMSESVIGNSSSGLIEVPAMKTATVNIGHRQDGRYKPDSVIDCDTDEKQIIQAISTACSEHHQSICKSMRLPYGDGHTCQKITRILSKVDLTDILYKSFYEGKQK